MSRRSVLLLLAAAPLLVVPSSGRSESDSASVTVTVVGVPSGYSVMARWLEAQLFARTVAPPKNGSAFSFSVQAPAGKGALKLWVLTMGQRGVNTATAVDATLRPGRRYTLAVTSDGAHSLRATLAEDPAVHIAQCHLTPACSGLAALATDARRYADNGSSSRAMTFQKLRVPCRAVSSSGVQAGWTAAPCGTSKALEAFSFFRISSASRVASASTGATQAPFRRERSQPLVSLSSRLSSVGSSRLSRSTGAQPAGGHPGRVFL